MEPQETKLGTFFVLIYEEDLAGKRLFVARSIGTGHVSIATSGEQALSCLVGTIEVSIRIAAELGEEFGAWLRGQRPDEPEYVSRYLSVAQERGVRVVPCEGHRVAMVSAA